MSVTLPFGKHKGKPIEEVPANYLQWALDNDVVRDPTLKVKILALLGGASKVCPTCKRPLTGELIGSEKKEPGEDDVPF